MCARWHFACTDLEEMLSASPIVVQDPDNDENTIQSIIVEGLGFHSSATDSHSEGFYVDEISFSSENRLFEFEYVMIALRVSNRSCDGDTVISAVSPSCSP